MTSPSPLQSDPAGLETNLSTSRPTSGPSQTLSSGSDWLRPIWVRPYALCTVLTVHAAVFGAFYIAMLDKPTPMKEVEVTVIPQGEAVTEVSDISAPQTAPVASPDPPVDSAPEIADRSDPDVSKPAVADTTPSVAPVLSADQPKVEQPDAPPLALAQPELPKTDKPSTQPSQQIREVLHKKKQQVEAKQAAMRARRLAEARAHARQQAAEFSEGAEAKHAGVQDGTSASAQMSDAAYAGIVSAELNRHKVYPAEARAEGAQGRVGVVLSIGPGGSIVAHSITRSSGNAAIDAAVHQMVAASHCPPPPRGYFHGSLGVNFSLDR